MEVGLTLFGVISSSDEVELCKRARFICCDCVFGTVINMFELVDGMAMLECPELITVSRWCN